MDKESLLLAEHIALIVSELLPFLPFVAGNGLVQGIVKAVVAVLTKMVSDKS